MPLSQPRWLGTEGIRPEQVVLFLVVSYIAETHYVGSRMNLSQDLAPCHCANRVGLARRVYLMLGIR